MKSVLVFFQTCNSIYMNEIRFIYIYIFYIGNGKRDRKKILIFHILTRSINLRFTLEIIIIVD